MSGLAVPTPYTWQVGDTGNAALLNAQVRDPQTFLLNPPLFDAIQTATTTSIASGFTWVSIAFADSAGILSDSYSGHSTTTNPSRYVAQVAGWYTVSGCVCTAPNATGIRGARIAKNGAAVLGMAGVSNAQASVANLAMTPTRDVQLAVGDYIELQGIQTSGSTASTDVTTDLDTGLWVKWSHA